MALHRNAAVTIGAKARLQQRSQMRPSAPTLVLMGEIWKKKEEKKVAACCISIISILCVGDERGPRMNNNWVTEVMAGVLPSSVI